MPPPLVLTNAATTAGSAEGLAQRLERAWSAGTLVGLCAEQERDLLSAELAGFAPESSGHAGAGVVVGSGGSAGGRRWCLQPLSHLEASARATGQWLASIGLDPAAVVQLNPLPLHHVSGLMPLVRSRLWGSPWHPVPPALMRRPRELAAALPWPSDRPVLLSLVPTQLERLMASEEGTSWLRRCALIWVGGGALPAGLAGRARAAAIRLAPCYGATETAAMVAVQPPESFLAGAPGCGHALPDVELRLGSGGALLVRTARLSPGSVADGALHPLAAAQGWWRSGDVARLSPEGLRILGRFDGAITSGGETVFPEQVEARLLDWARLEGLPLRHLLLLARADPLWGERLVALVRSEQQDPASDGVAGDADDLISRCRSLAQRLPPAQRPQHWLSCPELAPNALGKWERGRWGAWLRQTCDGDPRTADGSG